MTPETPRQSVLGVFAALDEDRFGISFTITVPHKYVPIKPQKKRAIYWLAFFILKDGVIVSLLLAF